MSYRLVEHTFANFQRASIRGIFYREGKGIQMDMRMSELTIIYESVKNLKHNPRNARTHSKRQIRQIAGSIKEFGFTTPVLIDKEKTIIAGHGRIEAAIHLGMSEVPTIRLDRLTQDQIRALMLADNHLAEKGSWDRAILAIELQHLLTIGGDFDIATTGFEIPEIDLILSDATEQPDKDDVFPVRDGSKPVTQPGDLWQLGKHRILCGNALQKESYSKLLAKRRAAVVFTDPPYNVPINGHVSGNGKIRHREFQMAAGEMGEFEFVSFLTTSFRLLAQFSANGSVHYIFMDWRHISELLTAGRQVYNTLLNLCIWNKHNAGLGSFYRSKHELIFVFKNGKERHRNNIELGRYGRNRSNVWEYPGVNSFSQTDEGNLLELHPTVKPVALVADALLDSSAQGDVVLDPFLGSGSTLIASERIGRCCHGIELDPLYIDVAIKRWQRHTGGHAIHAISGRRFDEVVDDPVESDG
jgi:DNA modification methylase